MNNCDVDADEAAAGQDYRCPVCKEPVTLCIGSVNATHFRHRPGSECLDSWSNDMSPWHRRLQLMFPAKYREKVIAYEGKVHRADVCIGKTVIEFQHSPISTEEFKDRNSFFEKAGYRIAWVFDLQDKEIEMDDWNPDLLRWKHPFRMLQQAPCSPSKNNPKFSIWVMLYRGLTEDDATLWKITWSSKDRDGGWPDYRRIALQDDPLILPMTYGSTNRWFFPDENPDEDKPAAPRTFQMKYWGEKGHKREDYQCPKTGKSLGKVFGRQGCECCPHCDWECSQHKMFAGKLQARIRCHYPAEVQ